MPAAFDDLWIGQVASIGAGVISEDELTAFCKGYAPHWDPADGLPDALIFTLWSKLETEASLSWPQTKRLAVDALRWSRNPPPGELLRGRLTVMGKDAVGDTKGVVIAQNDLLDEAGRLVFSCLTRSIFQRMPKAPIE
ncbi:acyl dehydratase [Asticcacaulis sp. EMRT-3]|uniref:acyl dehydratase n=1 Tax=Asticcacaulis sp. EMRT-3 TaxID=3040349 RepID=UPI0024AF218B|nr:acyl dehydratase [Asticcacaulis sp. EMRT-3]MDI7776233.1 acyl dehydratase [Asticcacaulis sp. EMRT-3]